MYQDDYFLADNGRLREIRRTWQDQKLEQAAFIRGKGKLAQEIQTNNERNIISRFDPSGRLILKEDWNGENLLEKQEYSYFADTDNVHIIKTENVNNRQISVRTYDQEGNLNEETVEKDNARISQIQYTWDSNGNKTEEREKKAEGLVVHKYFYDEADTLISEEEYIRGSLGIKTVYLENDEFYKEYYNQKGDAVIRSYFREDVKYKEEILEKGKVVRTREVQ